MSDRREGRRILAIPSRSERKREEEEKRQFLFSFWTHLETNNTSLPVTSQGERRHHEEAGHCKFAGSRQLQLFHHQEWFVESHQEIVNNHYRQVNLAPAVVLQQMLIDLTWQVELGKERLRPNDAKTRKREKDVQLSIETSPIEGNCEGNTKTYP